MELIFSKRAQQQLEGLYIRGCLDWGEAQAELYYDNLLLHFDALLENPYIYTSVEEIRAGYRRSVCGKHAIYYRIKNNRLEIMGVLRHQSLDRL